MQRQTLGQSGPAISANGLAGSSQSSGRGLHHRVESVTTIRSAVDVGVTFIDSLNAAFLPDIAARLRYPEEQLKGLWL